MRIFVTGNLGYIGSVMTPMLAEAGYDVWGLDTGYYTECILGERPDARVSRQLTTDIRRLEKIDLAGVDAVVHLAALSNDPTGELNPTLTEDINTNGSMRLAELAQSAGVQRFIFASSCSIYGQSEEAALTEESPFAPQTAYARSKVDAERYLSRLASAHFSPVYLRNATAYGLSPRLRLDLAVNNLTGWGCTTGQVKLQSDGRAWRPMVHITDICRAVLATLAAPTSTIHNEAFNIGSEQENYQIRDIANLVAQVVPHCTVTFAEGASADNRTYNVSFAKVRRLLPGFMPRWTVGQGIAELHAAFQQCSFTHNDFESRLFTRLKQLQYLQATQQVDDKLYWNNMAPVLPS